MSCTKKSWYGHNASQDNSNKAGGDNPVTRLADSQIFEPLSSATTATNIVSFESAGQQIILMGYVVSGTLYFKTMREDGSTIFTVSYPGLSPSISELVVCPEKNWFLTRYSGSSPHTYVFDLSLGTHLGEIPGDCWRVLESQQGNVVAVLENNGSFDFREITYDAIEDELTSALLWTALEPPLAYDSTRDNLVFPTYGEGRELLTGRLAYTFPSATTVSGSTDPLLTPRPWQASGGYVGGFSPDGSCIFPVIQQTRTDDYMEQRTFLWKITFPNKDNNASVSGTKAWAVDITDYSSNRLWGEETSLDIPSGTYYFNNELIGRSGYIIPRSIGICDQTFFALQIGLRFEYLANSAGHILDGEDGPPEYFPVHSYHGEVVEYDLNTGAKLRSSPLEGTSTFEGSGVLQGLLHSAESSSGDWTLAFLRGRYINDEQNVIPFTLAATVQGRTVRESIRFGSMSEESSPIPVYPYSDLPYLNGRGAALIGGRLYYPHVEENSTIAIRRLGTLFSCDRERRCCLVTSEDCEKRAGRVGYLGNQRFSVSTGSEFTLSYNGCTFDQAPASMGYGWHLDAYHKISESSNGILEYSGGLGGYEQWEKFKGEYFPVHSDNYVKAEKDPVSDNFTLTFPDFTRLHFDDFNRLNRVVDRAEFYIDYNYESVSPGNEGQARLISTVDCTGKTTQLIYATSSLTDRQPVVIKQVPRNSSGPSRETQFQYDSTSGRLLKIVLPNLEETGFDYYPDGRLWKVTEPGPRLALEYTYDIEGRVKTETAYQLSKTTYNYEPEERRVTQIITDEQTPQSPELTPAPTQTIVSEYDVVFNPTKVKDSLNNETTFEYLDPRNPHLVTTLISPNLSVTKWRHNRLGNVISITDALGVETKIEYAEDIGPAGSQYENLPRKIYMPPAGDTPETVTELSYNLRGQMIETKDAEGNTSKISYTSTPTVAGYQPEFSEDRNLHKIYYDYEASTGRLWKVRQDTGRSTGQNIVTLSYNDFDNLQQTVLGNNITTVLTEFDSVDRLVSSALSGLDIGAGLQSSFQYQNGLLTKVTVPSNNASGSQAREIVYSHDAAGRVLSQSQSFGAQNTHLERVSYSFDGFSRLRALTRKKQSETRRFLFDYDIQGRLTQAKDPLDKLSKMAFAPFCTEKSLTTARGTRVRHSYDVLCRPTQVEAGDPGVEELEVSNTRELRSFSYDDRGRLTLSSQQQLSTYGTARYGSSSYGEISPQSTQGLRLFDYNALDRLKSITFEDGTVLAYSYDNVGNTLSVSETLAGSSGTNITEYDYFEDNLLDKVRILRDGQIACEFSHEYDSIGRPSVLKYPLATGLEAHYEWDSAGRLKSLVYKKNGGDYRKFSYLHDNSGNITQITEVFGTVTSVSQYEYDWLDRVKVVKKGPTESTTSIRAIYTHDDVDNISKLELPENFLEYTFTVGDDDNLLSRIKTDVSSSPAIVFTENFLSDDDGNITKRTRTDGTDVFETSYKWNDFGKLIAVSSSLNGSSTDYPKQDNIFGISGIRRKKIKKDGQEVNEYTESLSTAVSKSQSGSLSYIRGSQLLGFETDGSFYYFLTDHLGSVRDIVRGTDGVAVQAYSYDELGNHSVGSGSGSVTSPKTFVGGLSVNDDTDDSALYLMGHRFYDCQLGRFLSRDPIGHAGGLNLYEYASSSPMTRSDPFGLEPYRLEGGVPNGLIRVGINSTPGIVNTGVEGGNVVYGFTVNFTNVSNAGAIVSVQVKDNIRAKIVTDLQSNIRGILKEVTDDRLAGSDCRPNNFSLPAGSINSVNVRLELSIDPKDLPNTTWKMTVPIEVEAHTAYWSWRPPFYHDQLNKTTFTLKQLFIVDKNGGTIQSTGF